MIVPLLCLALGMILGFFLAGCYYNRQAKKAAQERKRLHRGRRPAPSLTGRDASADLRETVPEPVQPLRASGEHPPMPEEQRPAVLPKNQVMPVLPPVRQKQDYQDQLEHLYQTFQTAETLSLQFRYSFPDNSLFGPGIGYLRSGSNQLLPDKSLFAGMNTMEGYAMNGTLWVFDMVLGDQTFTFSQIMDGQAGAGYVQPCAVVDPATVIETSTPGCYRLARAGKLKMQQMH